MEQLILIECRDRLGLNRERASIMCDAFLSLIHWTGRQGLLTEMERAKAENQIGKLMEQIGF